MLTSQSWSVLLCSRSHSLSHNKLPGLCQGQLITFLALKPKLLTSALTSSASAVWLTQTMASSQTQDGCRDGRQATALLNKNHVLLLLNVLHKKWRFSFCIESLFSITGGWQPTFTLICYCHHESFKSTPSLPGLHGRLLHTHIGATLWHLCWTWTRQLRAKWCAGGWHSCQLLTNTTFTSSIHNYILIESCQ